MATRRLAHAYESRLTFVPTGPRVLRPTPHALALLRFPLIVLGALAYASLATWLARAAGTRWVWAACAVVALGLAAAGAARVGTANPFSRTARYDPLLFFFMAAVVLGAPVMASSYAAVVLAAPAAADGATRGAAIVALWSALAFLAAIPLGFVAAVAIEVLWPH